MSAAFVSICMATYNQENFISKALDSVLVQKTNFAIEILIHDDASTDATTNIIKSYLSKYPDLIKPIFQIENQWSKGKRIQPDFNFPRAQGKYIAWLDGDDYWTDPSKIQKQVDLMEANPNCVLSYHDALKYSESEKKNNWKS